MQEGSQDEGVSHYHRSQEPQEKAHESQCRDDRRTHYGSRTHGQRCSGLQERGDLTKPVLSVAAEGQGRRDSEHQIDEAGTKGQGPCKNRTRGRKRASEECSLRSLDRTATAEKKRGLNLQGSLKGRHLGKEVRLALVQMIDEARAKGETLAAICAVLEVTPRSYYRWKSPQGPKPHHGGGGGRNKITPKEEALVVSFAKRHPEYRCRRIAYELERTSKVFIGKTKVSEILLKHGLNHPFERKPKQEKVIPAEMLLHEPYRKNLLWGMDWTWVHVGMSFMYCLVVIDWYSRKIVAWGLFHQITSFEVVAVVTDAVAVEKIDELPAGAMRPRLVADHGSANISKYTRTNVEVQGLELWLSGIGRPTGNARTERVIGTLKAEEITLQERYVDEQEARHRIKHAIFDYNHYRPNAGNGGFAPNSVHHMGRHLLMERRKRARQTAANLRRQHWRQDEPCST